MPFKVVFETALADVWTLTDGGNIGDKPGDIRWERDSEGMKCYKCIIYGVGDITVAGVAGECTGYDTLDGYKLHTVTSDYSACIGNIGAGILQANMVDTERGWVQIKGFATLTIDPVSAADGDPLTIKGAADGALVPALHDISTVLVDHVCAINGDDSDKEICCDFPF